MKHQLSGLQSEGHTLAQQLVATRADRDRYRAGHESLTSQLAAANEERDALAASEAAHLEQIAVLRTRLEGLVGQVEIEKEAWDAERARLQASLAAVTVERDGLAAGVEERDGQVGQLCARLETLQVRGGGGRTRWLGEVGGVCVAAMVLVGAWVGGERGGRVERLLEGGADLACPCLTSPCPCPRPCPCVFACRWRSG